MAARCIHCAGRSGDLAASAPDAAAAPNRERTAKRCARMTRWELNGMSESGLRPESVDPLVRWQMCHDIHPVSKRRLVALRCDGPPSCRRPSDAFPATIAITSWLVQRRTTLFRASRPRRHCDHCPEISTTKTAPQSNSHHARSHVAPVAHIFVCRNVISRLIEARASGLATFQARAGDTAQSDVQQSGPSWPPALRRRLRTTRSSGRKFDIPHDINIARSRSVTAGAEIESA